MIILIIQVGWAFFGRFNDFKNSYVKYELISINNQSVNQSKTEIVFDEPPEL